MLRKLKQHYYSIRFYLSKVWRTICNKPAESESSISRSLDYYIMQELLRGMERLIPYQEKNHIQTEEEIKEKQELLQLVKLYADGEMEIYAERFRDDGEKDFTKESLNKRMEIVNKDMDRLFKLLRKYFMSLRY